MLHLAKTSACEQHPFSEVVSVTICALCTRIVVLTFTSFVPHRVTVNSALTVLLTVLAIVTENCNSTSVWSVMEMAHHALEVRTPGGARPAMTASVFAVASLSWTNVVYVEAMAHRATTLVTLIPTAF